jgi:hypothetical protein
VEVISSVFVPVIVGLNKGINIPSMAEPARITLLGITLLMFCLCARRKHS